MQKPFVVADCLYGFACNPCTFSCPQRAISKLGTHSVPVIDYERCVGCMECVSHCPGLAIFGYDLKKNVLFLPVEQAVEEGSEVYLVDNDGKPVGEGIIEKVLRKPNKTDVVRVRATTLRGTSLMQARGFVVRTDPLRLPLKGGRVQPR